jgi:hypothetical protein
MAKAALYLSLVDVQRAATSPVDPYLTGKIVTDAIGRQWVLNEDAVEALAAAEAAWQEELRLRAEHREYVERHAQRRRDLMTQVREKTLKKLGPLASSAEQRAVVTQAQHEAFQELAQSEGAEPLGFYEWRDGRAH